MNGVRGPLRAAVVALAIGHLVAFVVVAAMRLGYPYDLEWLEGGSVDTMHRIVSGRSLFGPPSLEFIPFNYTPLYYYAAVPFTRLLGDTFLPLRLLSLLASLGAIALLAYVVRRMGGGGLGALLAASLFAAAYWRTDAWYDLARPDMLYLLLLVAAIAVLLLDGRVVRGAVAAGVLFALAYLTKQTAAVAAVPILLWVALARRPWGWLGAATFAALVFGSLVAFDAVSGGWYRYYTVDVAAGHRILWLRLLFFPYRCLAPAAIAVGFAFAALGPSAQRASLLVCAGSLLISAWYVSLYLGGALNMMIPGFAAVALLFGLGAGRLLHPAAVTTEPRAARREALWLGACLLQLVVLIPDPRPRIPTAADRAAGDALTAWIAAQPGDALVPFHSYLARRAGKPGHFHSMALGDVLVSGGGATAARIDSTVHHALSEGRWRTVVLDGANRTLVDSIPGYGPELPFFEDADVLRTRAGDLTRPEFVRTRP